MSSPGSAATPFYPRVDGRPLQRDGRQDRYPLERNQARIIAPTVDSPGTFAQQALEKSPCCGPHYGLVRGTLGRTLSLIHI